MKAEKLKMTILNGICFLLSLIAAVPSYAIPLDLKAAVSMALERNPAIRQAREVINGSESQTSIVKSGLYPNLNLSGNTTYRKDSSGGKSGALAFGGEPYHTYNLDLNLTQPLFVYGSLAAVRQSRMDQELKKLDLEIAERDLSANVIKAFYNVILTERLIHILEDSQKTTQESLATAQSRFRTGRGQLLDVLQVKTQLALQIPKVEAARNNLSAAIATLASYIGEDHSSQLELKGGLPSLYLSQVEKLIDFKQFHLPELEKVRVTYDQLQEGRDVTLGKNLPNLKFVGDYLANNYTKADLLSESSRSWSMQLVLTVPLFSGLSSVHERRNFASQGYQLEHQKRNVGDTLILSQIKNRKAVESAETSLKSSEEAAKLSQESMNEARRSFRLATIDFVQFLAVQQALLDAFSSLENLKFAALSAYCDFFVASGQHLDKLVDLLTTKVDGKTQ